MTKNWVIPRYLKLYYQLINSGEKSYICEHDIFVFIQELEGTAPTAKGKKASFVDELKANTDDTILNADLAKKFKNASDSIFTEAFVDDCILMFKELKKRPEGGRAAARRNLSMMSMKSGMNLPAYSSNNDEMNRTQNSLSISPSKKVGNATFANKPVNTPNSGAGNNPMPLESPRNQRYQQTNEFDIYSS